MATKRFYCTYSFNLRENLYLGKPSWHLISIGVYCDNLDYGSCDLNEDTTFINVANMSVLIRKTMCLTYLFFWNLHVIQKDSKIFIWISYVYWLLICLYIKTAVQIKNKQRLLHKDCHSDTYYWITLKTSWTPYCFLKRSV